MLVLVFVPKAIKNDIPFQWFIRMITNHYELYMCINDFTLLLDAITYKMQDLVDLSHLRQTGNIT